MAARPPLISPRGSPRVVGSTASAVAGLPETTDHGRRWRGDLLRGVPGGVRGRRRAEDDAVRARVPRGVHRGVALGQQLLPALPLQAAHPGGGGRRRPTPTAGKPAGIDDDGRVVSCQWHNATLVRI